LEAVLDNLVVSPPEGTEQNLCGDKGYTGEPAKQIIESHGYIPHVKERGEEINSKKNVPGYRPRRWVVELTHSWFNRFRKLLVRLSIGIKSVPFMGIEKCTTHNQNGTS